MDHRRLPQRHDHRRDHAESHQHSPGQVRAQNQRPRSHSALLHRLLANPGMYARCLKYIVISLLFVVCLLILLQLQMSQAYVSSAANIQPTDNCRLSMRHHFNVACLHDVHKPAQARHIVVVTAWQTLLVQHCSAHRLAPLLVIHHQGGPCRSPEDSA